MATTTNAPSRGVALGAALALLTAALLGGAYLARPTDARAGLSGAMPESRQMEATTGIRILSAHVAGSGGIIDVRYQVLDAAKANIVEGDPNNTPALVNKASGDSLQNTAAMRKGHERREAGTYFLLYYDHSGLVKAGDVIDITLGGQTLTDVPVT